MSCEHTSTIGGVCVDCEQQVGGKPSVKVFVYGTLIPGQRLYPGIERFVNSYEDAKVENHSLYMANSGWYPVMVEEPDGMVKGVLLDVSEEALDTLDRIEGAPYLYERKLVETTERVEAWTYIGNEAKPAHHIPDGNFVTYIEAL